MPVVTQLFDGFIRNCTSFYHNVRINFSFISSCSRMEKSLPPLISIEIKQLFGDQLGYLSHRFPQFPITTDSVRVADTAKE